MNGPHYQLTGPDQAPVVILAGSLGTDLSMWDPQVPALSEHYRVLRYDHPGHGASPRPDRHCSIGSMALDVAALLDQLGLERVSFCGLSLGGMVGMWLASHLPDRIDRLVLACTAPRLPPARAWLDRAATVRRDGTGALAATLERRWFSDATLADRPPFVDRLLQSLRQCDDEGYARCCEAIAGMDQRGCLRGIVAPTLVIAGAEDRATEPAVVRHLADTLVGARYVALPGAAHLANVERPAAFTELVRAHLGGEAT